MRTILSHRAIKGERPASPPMAPPSATGRVWRLGILVLLSDFGRIMLMWALVLFTLLVLYSGADDIHPAPPSEAVVLAFVVCIAALMLPVFAAIFPPLAVGAASSLGLDAATIIDRPAWTHQGLAVAVWAQWLVAATLWYPDAAASLANLPTTNTTLSLSTAERACMGLELPPRHYVGMASGICAICLATLHVLIRGHWNASVPLGVGVLLLAATDTLFMRAAWLPRENPLLCDTRWYWERALRVGALCVGFFAHEASNITTDMPRKSSLLFFAATLLALLGSGWGPFNFAAAWTMLLVSVRVPIIRAWTRPPVQHDEEAPDNSSTDELPCAPPIIISAPPPVAPAPAPPPPPRPPRPRPGAHRNRTQRTGGIGLGTVDI